ncbi:nucleoside transporter C-terminal domain-containing protein [Vibrio metschnikovii]
MLFPKRKPTNKKAEIDIDVQRQPMSSKRWLMGRCLDYELRFAVGATLLAFVSVIALLNGLLGWVGDGIGITLSFELILGYLFAPIAWLLGIPWHEAITAGSLDW